MLRPILSSRSALDTTQISFSREKIVLDDPELSTHLAAVLRAVAAPDHVASDPVFAERTRYYVRGSGPSQWLLVVGARTVTGTSAGACARTAS